MKPLVQYYIKQDLKQSVIKKIWREFLLHDNRWHFFHEGNYCLIRTDGRCFPLERRLVVKKIKYDIGVWEDPHKTVRKYQRLYEPIFHNLTILGLVRKDDEVYAMLNRVSHCFINMSGLNGYEGIALMAKLMVMEIMLYTNYHTDQTSQQIADFLRPMMARLDALEKQKKENVNANQAT